MKPSTPDATFAAATFEAAEERRLEASLSATVSQRLQWLEEALAFAARMGALDERLQPDARPAIPARDGEHS